MRSFVVALSALLGHGSRVLDQEAIALDLDEQVDQGALANVQEFESEEALEEAENEYNPFSGGGYGRGLLRKYKKWDAKAAQAQFSSSAEKLLVDGEEVEMAWKKGEHDVLMFTNHRVLHVDSKMNFNNINKKLYTSSLWRTMGSWAIKTVDDIADNDCELELYDNYVAGRPDVLNFDVVANIGISMNVEHKFSPVKLGMWHIDFLAIKQVGEGEVENAEDGVDIFEVNKYVEKKITEAKKWQKANSIGTLIANSRMWWSASRHSIPNRLSKLEQMDAKAGVDELNRMGEILGGDEKVLYAFKESKRIGKQDWIVMTNKRVVMADYRRFYSDAKVKFFSVPYDDSPMRMINSWEVETAGDVADLDAEIDLGTIVGEQFRVDLRKKSDSKKENGRGGVTTQELLDMHYYLSNEIINGA